MKDINTPLLKSYYAALATALAPVKVYEGEEPDNLLDPIYVVLSNVTSTDDSTKSSNGHTASVQVTVNTWKQKYNNSKDMNEVAGKILQAIKPFPESTLQADGIDIVTTSLSNDSVTNYGKLAGRVYISRNLIFSHYISYI